MAYGGLAIPYTITPFIDVSFGASPVVSVTGAMEVAITASTSTPSVSMELIAGRLMAITASTKTPTVSMTISGDNVLTITASTSTPKVAMSLVQDLYYAITASTKPPVVYIQMSGPTPAIAAGETTAWCVNMATGAHSRYTDYPDASATSAINAYALTAVTDFGDDKEKYCPDIFISCRLPDNGITVDTITDEWIVRTDYEIEPCDNVQGLTRRRRKLAKGIKGQNWQFRLNNVSSGGFTIKSAEPMIVKSQRRV